ncbi:response regulator transcription factor [Nesterenkonia sp.]|uniref:response regulator transcription factor n=1 Tax=Nesterenkonia sp. TaxID=704201 RepID=UPI002624F9FF|nr:response regulator transcription factor [Nesterenkonia sp.]
MSEDSTEPDGGGPIRVMLVDDQHLLRMGFRLILEGEEDLEIVGEAADGIEAVETIQALADPQRTDSTPPDVVLMDVRMPRMDGIEATAQIVQRWCETKVIILTTFDLDEYAFSGLQAGASAFLLKDVTPEDLVDAVRVVASGDAVVAPRITQRLLEVYLRQGAAPGAPDAPGDQAPAAGPAGEARSGTAGQPQGAAAALTGAPAAAEPETGAAARKVTGEQVATAMQDSVVREPLTARETEVLFAVAEGLSNAEIAARFFLSEATVKTHVRRILTKLQLRDRVQAVVYVYQAGLLD